MAPERCNNSVSKYASFLLSRGGSTLRNNGTWEDSLAMVFKCYSVQNISRRSSTKIPKHGEGGEAISSLPCGEGHERPLGRRKREAEESDEGLQENRNTLRAYAHIHAQFVLRTDIHRFGGQFDRGSERVYRDAEVEVGLRSDGRGTSRGIKDGERDGYRHPEISREKRYVAHEMWRHGFLLAKQGDAHAFAR